MEKYKVDGERMSEEEMRKYAEDKGLSIEAEGMEQGQGNELVSAEIINPENSQRIIRAIILIEDEEYESAKKEMTLTSRYHDWSGTAADNLMEELMEEGEISEDKPDKSYITEYNRAIDKYNQYRDASAINEDDDNNTISKKIMENNNSII